MMRTEEHRPVRLSEYRPPDWLVDTVDLDIKLHPTQTPVTEPSALRLELSQLGPQGTVVGLVKA